MVKHGQRGREPHFGQTLQIVCLEQPRTEPVALLGALPGTPARELAVLLMQHSDHVARVIQLLPPPPASPRALREWHEDAWRALDDRSRESAALVVGPTAPLLASCLGDEGDPVVLAADPLAALAIVGIEPRIQELVAKGDGPKKPATVRSVANPHSRIILSAVRDPTELPVTNGPPRKGARKWRASLTEALTGVHLLGPSNVPALGQALAPRLLVGSRWASRAAHKLMERYDQRATNGVPAKLASNLRELNWLDLELLERASEES